MFCMQHLQIQTLTYLLEEQQKTEVSYRRIGKGRHSNGIISSGGCFAIAEIFLGL